MQYLTQNARELTGPITSVVESLAQLSEAAHSFLDYQNENKETTSSKATGNWNKQLIFELERFQINTVKYNKKIQPKRKGDASGEKDLMSYFKRSTARAFRINSELVANTLDLKKRKQPDEDENDDVIDDSDDESSAPPPRKRQARSEEDDGIEDSSSDKE